MEKVLVWMSDNYLIVLGILAFLIIAIVGFAVDDKKENIDANLKEAPIEEIEKKEKEKK